MKNFTAQEWAEYQRKHPDYTGEWSDNAWNRSRDDIPPEWIGRKTMLQYDPQRGTCLVTEGEHFTIEGRDFTPVFETWRATQ